MLNITQSDLKSQDYSALTFLNLSAVYSEVKKHQKAILYANKAIKVLATEIDELRSKETQIQTVDEAPGDIVKELTSDAASPAKRIEEEQTE